MQDLTPQLRTRLGKVERTVGVFVTIATLLLIAGFTYYVAHTAKRKGWFLLKFPYHTYLKSATGINIGDQVKLMGFNAGVITKVTAMDPFYYLGNVYVEFELMEPYQGYIWDDSRVKLATGDFLGKRNLEMIQGGLSGRTNLHASYQVDHGVITGVFDDQAGKYLPFTKESKGYHLLADEDPALAARFELLAAQIEKALPSFLGLTNQITAILTNTVQITHRASEILDEVRPVITNVAVITQNLKEPKGALGEWLLPTNLHADIRQAIASANATLGAAGTTLTNANTNLTAVAAGLTSTLDNLANLTSNLNAQVEANTNILGNISGVVVHSDEMIQGLKRHWFLRSAFKDKAAKTNAPSRAATPPKAGKR